MAERRITESDLAEINLLLSEWGTGEPVEGDIVEYVPRLVAEIKRLWKEQKKNPKE